MKTRCLLIAFSMFLLCVGCTGCGIFGKTNQDICGGVYCKNTKCTIHFVKTTGEGDQIAVMIKILDDSETRWLLGSKIWATKAELWLKLSISGTSDIYWLYPLNVNHAAAGNREITLKTPYCLSRNRQEKISIELLDDDKFTDDEIKTLCDTVKTTGILLCDGINIYSKKFSQQEILSIKNKKDIESLLGDSVKCIVKNMKPFDSYGNREYIALFTGSEHFANPITIVDENGRARCDLRFHVIK